MLFLNASSVPSLLAPLKFKLALKQACRKSVPGALVFMVALLADQQTLWWSPLALRSGLWVSGGNCPTTSVRLRTTQYLVLELRVISWPPDYTKSSGCCGILVLIFLFALSCPMPVTIVIALLISSVNGGGWYAKQYIKHRR